jgi:hypothetical protein
MKCKVVFQERECWLPASPSSSFQMCRRCHFYKITEILDCLTNDYKQGSQHPSQELFLNDLEFLQELLHPAREQALLNLLATLYNDNKIQFFHLIRKLKRKTVFSILLTKRVQTHVPGPRCKMYREVLKDKDLYNSNDLCWNCWSCISWCLKLKDGELLQKFKKSYLSQLHRLTFDIYVNTGSRVFLDCLVTFHLQGSDHLIRIFFDHIFHRFPLDVVKGILLLFFQEIPMLDIFFHNKQNEFLPLPLRDESVVTNMYKEIKRSIKEKTNLFKEELVMRTWHPSRLFPWCLDIQELEEFGVSSADRVLGRYGF